MFRLDKTGLLKRIISVILIIYALKCICLYARNSTPEETESQGEKYYAFVLVGNNHIIRYSKEENAYHFEEINELSYEIEDIKQWENRIYVTADEMQGNILGYSLFRMPPSPKNNMYYERDMPYLLDENIVGKGIYVSDYMCETEVFLGDILKEVLTSRGAVSDENRQYFTEYALQQLGDTDWKSLDAEWNPNPYAYDRVYSMNPVSGSSGYQFFYSFYMDKEKTEKEETNIVNITLYVDGDGKICEIKISISMESMENNRIEKWIVMNGLFDDTYSEQVILDGSPCNEKMVWDFERYFRRFMYPDAVYEQDNEGFLESGNVCASAENLANLFLQVMENRGTDLEKYAEWFEYDMDFSHFADTDWELLEKDWIANEEYNCFFIDNIYDSGYAGFRFYFYPDFKTMGVDTAMAVMIDCNVDVYKGMLGHTSIDIFPVTEEEYQAMKQRRTESRIPVVEKGNAILGKTAVTIPVIDGQVNYMPISKFMFDAVTVNHSSRKVKEELWGFTDAAEAGDYLGKKFLQDFVEDNVETGEIYRLIKDKETIHSALYAIEGFIDDGWQVDGQYDCFYVKNNEAEGCMHLQYYFYSEGVSEEQTKGKVLVIDVYLSELGIEHMRVNAFCVETEGGIACTPEETESQEEKLTDEYPYIDYDYIEQYHEILFHNITTAPKDDYDDTVLAEYLKEDIEKDKELLKNGSGEERPLTIAYHVFDFNDDGLEDYLVCLEGTFWRYDGKNTVRIYMQEQNSTLREAFTGYVYFCRPDNQPPVAVLAERVEGCHSLALPGPDSLLRYDKERGQYEFCEVESNAEEENLADEIHVGMNEEEYAEKKEMYENIKRINMSVYIDYEFIEAKHEILRHNIISEPKDANENVLLKEALKDDMEDAQQMYEKGIISSPLYIDYFPFDFNDDGLEDYLVCYHGSGWSGTAGNHVCIYIQENDGTLSSVFSITMRLYDYVSRYDHSPLAILDEKDDGYYAFVLVGNNRIIRYNKEEKKYQFEDEN